MYSMYENVWNNIKISKQTDDMGDIMTFAYNRVDFAYNLHTIG